MDFIVIVFPLLMAWVLDLLLGDPSWLPHPVVLFGKVISFCERKFNRGRSRRMKGGVVAVSLIASVFILTWWILKSVSGLPWLFISVQVVLIFFCLAGTTLVREVKMVFEAVDVSLEKGRRQVGRIVGRDTSDLSSKEIKTAALETLAENLSDGVVAPLFWYALLGVPGMMAYKMINTLDSMIGYKNERYRQFGMVAARIDDFANYIPARLTSLIMLIVSGKMGLCGFVRRFGSQHASPNSGYPEAALAGILNCRFGGTHDYFGESVYKPYIGITDRDFTFQDMKIATDINRRVEFLTIFLTLAVRLLILI